MSTIRLTWAKKYETVLSLLSLLAAVEQIKTVNKYALLGLSFIRTSQSCCHSKRLSEILMNLINFIWFYIQIRNYSQNEFHKQHRHINRLITGSAVVLSLVICHFVYFLLVRSMSLKLAIYSTPNEYNKITHDKCLQVAFHTLKIGNTKLFAQCFSTSLYI